ncbi:sodium/glutamate symporter [Salinisphaera sp. T31B1]|uniref:sodium/glutamate symporter n=1 Tax=Salinisphaera sp. T31B1 TaxID=727963 RepID=UPI003340BEF5
MEFNAIFTLLVAVAVLVIGQLAVRRIGLLREFNIPVPVVGGLIATIVITALRPMGFNVSFFDGLQEPFMLLFFGSIGLGADFRMIAAGGRKLILFFVLVAVLLVLQDALGVGIAAAFGLDPLLGLLGGSITMSGGHGTGAAWAKVFGDQHGIEGAFELAMACATFGLVFGSLVGGPAAHFLIRRMKKNGVAVHTSEPETEAEAIAAGGGDGQTQGVATANVLPALLVLLIGIAAGYGLRDLTYGTAFYLPTFVWVLFTTIVLGNLGRMTGIYRPHGESVSEIGYLSLSVFLALALMSLKLWELAGLALPILAILVAQLVLVFVYTTQITFRAMGGNYDAAVLVAGNCGFGMGATPTAIANMQAVTDRHGPSRLAFIIVPVVGGFLIDIANAFIIKGFIAFL